jgi:hypothetical protein
LSLLLRFIVLYAALYGALGVLSPFLPQFLEQRGLSAQEIGTCWPSARRSGSRPGYWPGGSPTADAPGEASWLAARRRASQQRCTCLFDSFWSLLIVSLTQATALAPLVPLADATTVTLAVTVPGASVSERRCMIQDCSQDRPAEFLAEFPGQGWLDAKLELASAQRKIVVALIVDDRLNEIENPCTIGCDYTALVASIEKPGDLSVLLVLGYLTRPMWACWLSESTSIGN